MYLLIKLQLFIHQPNALLERILKYAFSALYIFKKMYGILFHKGGINLKLLFHCLTTGVQQYNGKCSLPSVDPGTIKLLPFSR